MIDRDYLVFWSESNRPRASVVRVVHPPHDEPRGTILNEFVHEALWRERGNNITEFRLHGVVELGNPAWSAGANREITMGDGRPGILECTRAGWQVRVAL